MGRLYTGYGGRKPTETSVTEFCYKSVNLSLEELKNIKVILFSDTRSVQIAKFPEIIPEISHFLRRLERVFRCYIACETMEDYKEGCLMVWANYMSPCNSIIGLYFKGTCDVISVTMATHEVHKSVL